jgi:hypothetical protein
MPEGSGPGSAEHRARWMAGALLLTAPGVALALLASACSGTAAASHAPARRDAVRPEARSARPARPGQAVVISLPGNARVHGTSFLLSVACPARGDCVAGGYYTDKAGNSRAVIAAQADGRWSRAIEVPLPAGSAPVQNARVNSVACTGAGDCVAVGLYFSKVGSDHGFAVTEQHGRWGRAVSIGSPRNGDGRHSNLQAVACASAGNCTAVGDYRIGPVLQAMTVTETSGRWGRPDELVMPSDAGSNPLAYMTGIACPRPADCVSGGYYDSTISEDQAAVGFVETAGVWHGGTEVAPASRTPGHGAELDAVSCGPTACLAAGSNTSSNPREALAVTESAGHWSGPVPMTSGPVTLSAGGASLISCPSTRRCYAAVTSAFLPGGGFAPPPIPAGTPVLLALAWTGGLWVATTAAVQPAHAGLGGPAFDAVGCAADGYCVAVGADSISGQAGSRPLATVLG